MGGKVAGPALEGLIGTGTHRTTWTLSKPPASETWEVSGDVDLQALRQPRGTVHGTAPVNWHHTPGGKGAGFPQHFAYPLIYGELDGGLDVVLLDAHLTVHSEGPREGVASFKGGNAHFDAWAALVGRGAPRSGPLLVDSGIIQVPFLEAFFGRSPLAEKHIPTENPYRQDKGSFAATIDKESLQTWQDGDAEVSLYYQISADVNGWYSFGLAFSPVVEVELSTPIPLADFMIQWAWPLRGLIAAATGRRVDIDYLSCTPFIEGDERPNVFRQFQVFNASVGQTPYTSSNTLRDKDISAIRLGRDGASLLALLRRWQDLRSAENPILNTYDISAVGPSQHPRARFLLLLQALEGLYGYENRAESRQIAYGSERESVLGRCEEALDAASFRFVKRFLPRRPPLGLDSVLKQMLKELPVDIAAELTDSWLVKAARAADPQITSTLDAIRDIRNKLSHGSKTYEQRHLAEVADVLERVVRGHLMRLLGVAPDSITRVLTAEL